MANGWAERVVQRLTFTRNGGIEWGEATCPRVMSWHMWAYNIRIYAYECEMSHHGHEKAFGGGRECVSFAVCNGYQGPMYGLEPMSVSENMMYGYIMACGMRG